MKNVTKEELDYFLSKINFAASFIDAKATDIMNRLGQSLKSEEDIKNKTYKNFFYNIDWVRLGRRLEEHGFDQTGWENLGKAWRENDDEGVIAYIYLGFNKISTYSDLLDNMDKLPEDEIEVYLDLINNSYMLQKYGKNWREEMEIGVK